MSNFNDSKIDEYLLGILPPEEIAIFEKQIQANKALANEVSQRRIIIDHLEALEDRRMVDQVKQIHRQERSGGGRIVPFKRFRLLAVAALILVSLGAGWWLWNSSQTPQSQDLYATYYAPYDLRFGDRSDQKDLLNEAGGYYIDGNYEKAAQLFQNVLNENPEEAKAMLALGIAQMEMEQWNDAIPTFQQLIQTNDFLYADKAKWYLALTYYQLSRLDESKKLLKELSNKKSADFSAKAGVLLEKIK